MNDDDKRPRDNQSPRNYVHYNARTGAIRQVGISFGPFELAGYALAELPDDVDIHAIGPRHKVDLFSVTISVDGPPRAKLTQYTDREWRERSMPPLDMLKAMRDVELRLTDSMFPHDDEPGALETTQALISYRQQLQSLGTRATPESFIDAWPMRPNGTDALAAHRTLLRKK